MLSAILRQMGVQPVQWYGHLHGLEYLLQKHPDAAQALECVRSTVDVQDRYSARQTLERAANDLSAEDTFSIIRNNVRFKSAKFDGTLRGLFEVVRHRESHLFYRYFIEQEIPAAIDSRACLYGISINDERQLVAGVVLASLVKELMPQTLVVLGGNYWSRMEHIFGLPEFGELFDHCDAIVYREGFQPVLDLVASLKPHNVPGVVWRDGERQVHINSGTNSPMQFEQLPTPEFNEEDARLQWCPGVVRPLYTMSNCPTRCSFCAISGGSDSFLATPRSMSPRRVAEHMRHLGGGKFDVFDETFTIPRQLGLGKELRALGVEATWQCYLTATRQLNDPDLCHSLYEAGCRSVQLGLESLHPETLGREKKQWNSPLDYIRILRNLKEAGIQTHVFIIVGLPGQPLHYDLKWIPFLLNEAGDYILTIKASRYRLARKSPEEQGTLNTELIEVLPDVRPLSLNRDFRYRQVSRKRVDQMVEVLEATSRRHWGYQLTSTLPWWSNRSHFSWGELREAAVELAKVAPREEEVDLSLAFTKVSTIYRDETGQAHTPIKSWEELRALANTL